MKRAIILKNNAQTILEYTMVISLVVAVLVTMGTMFRRGLSGTVKTVVDQIGVQEKGEQVFDDSGHLIGTNTMSNSFSHDRTRELLGEIEYFYNAQTNSESKTSVNLGIERNE